MGRRRGGSNYERRVGRSVGLFGGSGQQGPSLNCFSLRSSILLLLFLLSVSTEPLAWVATRVGPLLWALPSFLSLSPPFI